MSRLSLTRIIQDARTNFNSYITSRNSASDSTGSIQVDAEVGEAALSVGHEAVNVSRSLAGKKDGNVPLGNQVELQH